MTGKLRILLVLVMTFILGACAPFMVPLNEVDGEHMVNQQLTKEQVKEAILEGAENAGWRAKDLEDDKILASFLFKTHAVNVEISYTSSEYLTQYKSSNEMKMFCLEQDKKSHRNMVVSGRKDCPGNQPPKYIHKAYKQWVNSLDSSIQTSLSSM
jgi:hypothetical protein